MAISCWLGWVPRPYLSSACDGKGFWYATARAITDVKVAFASRWVRARNAIDYSQRWRKHWNTLGLRKECRGHETRKHPADQQGNSNRDLAQHRGPRSLSGLDGNSILRPH